jgi:hypothetical protein
MQKEERLREWKGVSHRGELSSGSADGGAKILTQNKKVCLLFSSNRAKFVTPAIKYIHSIGLQKAKSDTAKIKNEIKFLIFFVCVYLRHLHKVDWSRIVYRNGVQNFILNIFMYT